MKLENTVKWAELQNPEKWEPSDTTAFTADSPELAQEMARRWNSYDSLLKTLERIESGSEDTVPPYREMSRSLLQAIARDALAKVCQS